MLESFLAVPLHFTVEFLGLLVTVGGALLVVSRPMLIPGSPANRALAASGLGALAVAQAAHGGSFLSLDGNEALAGLQAAGLVLVAGALLNTSRGRATGAFAALPIHQPVALWPAGGALFLVLSAVVGLLRGGPRAFRRLAIAAAFMEVAHVFTALSRPSDVGTGIAHVGAYVSHGLKGAGFVALASWLWTEVRSSVRLRFVASFAALLVIVVLVLSTALTGVISRNIEVEELSRLRSQLVSVNQTIEEEKGELLGDVKDIAASQDLQGLLAARRDKQGLAGLQSTVEGLAAAQQLDISFAVLLDPDGRRLASAGKGPAINDSQGYPRPTQLSPRDLVGILGSPILEEVRGPVSESASPDRIGGALAVVAAAEVREPGRAQPAGIVAIGRFVDAFFAEEASSRLKPAKLSLIIGEKAVASELPRPLDQGLDLTRDAATRVDLGRVASEKDVIGGRSYFNAFAPVLNDSGAPIRDVALALSAPADIVLSTREDVTRTLFLVAMGTGAVVFGLAWLSGRMITGPIQMLTDTARAVREGNLAARARVAGGDEVGQLGETFNEMTSALVKTTDDLKEAASEEHRLRSRIETIIESMADGLVAVDADRRVLAFNPQAESLTGITAADAIGRAVDEVIEVRDLQGGRVRAGVYDLVQDSLDGVFLISGSRPPVPVAVDSAVLRGPDGEVAGGVAILRDKTHDREVERMKSEFLSNISHELRTPLTPIKGYAEILGRQNVPPEKAERFANGILDSAARLERIVELLLDFAGLEAGSLAPRAKPVDLGELLHALAEDVRSKASHQVVVDVKASLPKVIGDERLLRRSLEEVLDNAVKFSPDGGVIRLEASGISSNGAGHGRSVEVVVSDEGIGIPAEDLSKIFSDFHQLDGSETRTYGGLGLGLAFVRRIVEAHDGSVEVQSTPDLGTRLKISIPAVQEDAR